MIKGALVGFGITLGLAIIPIVHFVTIWPAPFIGGFVGGSQAKADPATALTMGLLMGVLMLAPAFLVLWVMGRFFELGSGGLIIGLAGSLAAYVALLGGLGAMLGGHASRRQTGV